MHAKQTDNLPEFRLFVTTGRTVICLAVLFAIACAQTACFTLSEAEDIALSGYKQNSKSYYNSGKYPEAINQCYKGLEIDDDDVSLHLTLAWSLLRNGGKENLFRAYDQFQKTDSMRWFEDDYRISLGMGQTCYKIAILFSRGLEEFERKTEEFQDAEKPFEEKIIECRSGKNRYIEEAIDNLTATLDHERQKNNIEAILTLGQVYAYTDRLDEAVKFLTRGLDLLQESMSFHQKHLDQNKDLTGDGQRHYSREIRRNLKWEKQLRDVLATVYRNQNKNQLALEQYNHLEDRDLFDNYQHYNRALVLQELKRYEDAIKEYDLFLRLASVTGKEFDEDEHFHLAIEKQNQCKRLLVTPKPSGEGARK